LFLIDVLGGVSQRSILGPLLFVIFINDLDDGVINKFLKFADDTKTASKVGMAENVRVLQADLHKLFQWLVQFEKAVGFRYYSYLLLL